MNVHGDLAKNGGNVLDTDFGNAITERINALEARIQHLEKRQVSEIAWAMHSDKHDALAGTNYRR